MGAAHADRLVAVVGLSCRLPHAENLDAFWELLRSGASGVTEVGDDRWPGPGDPARPAAVRHGGFLPQVDTFDPGFFGI